MSDSAAAVAAPVVNTPATSAETSDSSQENAELDAAEAAEEGEVVAEPVKTAKVDTKKAKENEKRLKSLNLK